MYPRHRLAARHPWAAASVAISAIAASSLLAGQALAAGAGSGAQEQQVRQPSSHAPVGALLPPNDRARGMVFDGLQISPPGSACDHLLTASLPGVTLCSHGPDEAPAGIDVTKVRTPAELAAATTSGSSTTSGGLVPCYGDGTTGDRVQVIYAHAADVADRYADLASLIPQWIANADATFADSAAETGGVRHVRWVTDSNCNLAVDRVQLSSTGDDSFSNTVAELQSLGYKRTDRKYLVLTDANVYCGIGGIQNDDSASSRNANNSGPSYARVDSGCWGLTNPVEAHELMHNLGGVQLSAPHSSGGWHCTDEYDRMCYAENINVQLTYVCTADHERLFDCGHDDYFSTAAGSGSYLANHWNAANSAFLESVEPLNWSSADPTTTTSPSPSPSPSPTDSTTTTTTTSTATSVTYSGSLNRKNSSAVYPVTAGAGDLTVDLTFRKAKSMTATVTDAQGTVLGTASGNDPVHLTESVSGGNYSVELSGGSANYSVTLTYIAP